MKIALALHDLLKLFIYLFVAGINGNNDAVSKDEYDIMKKAMAQLEVCSLNF